MKLNDKTFKIGKLTCRRQELGLNLKLQVSLATPWSLGPGLVRSSSPSGYILPRCPPVANGLGFSFLFQSVIWVTPMSLMFCFFQPVSICWAEYVAANVYLKRRLSKTISFLPKLCTRRSHKTLWNEVKDTSAYLWVSTWLIQLQ